MNNRKYSFLITEDESAKNSLGMSSDFFLSSNSNTILMPPPNITGNLHLGHTLNLTIQDFIARLLFINGQAVDWISGLDHSGIATQSKIEKMNLPGIETRENRKDFVFSFWYPQQRKKFAEQWKNLGLFLDYRQNNFTMDSISSQRVKEFFIKLYNDGLIYRSTRMINWDPFLQTAVSDIETEIEEIDNEIFYISYSLEKGGNLVVATSRPETIFADVALFVNPKDARYLGYVGEYAINPLTGEKIRILSSEKVSIEFGSGVLKCTPGHDFKDYELAKEFQLPFKSCYGKDGILDESAGQWRGMHFSSSRASILADLSAKNLLFKSEKYISKRIFSQRSGATIEPIISLQWFLDLPSMIRNIEEKNSNFLSDINFLPSNIKEKLITWKFKAHEWCISRQLWWGHSIPAWYNEKGDLFVGDAAPQEGNWTKETDVLDTWFSSSLWPLITNTKDGNFLPIDYLVTGSDLLFFWLFKMIVFAFYFHQKSPFKNVLIHGLIRDENKKKMSKSSGNGIEQEVIISNYGVDSLRLFLLSNCILGSDITFDYNKLKGYYFFLQKLWSIASFISENISIFFRRVIDYPEIKDLISRESNSLNMIVEKWILFEFSLLLKEFRKQSRVEINTAHLSDLLLKFTRDKISDRYLFFTKGFDSEFLLIVLAHVFQKLLIILNPFIPFLTRHLYFQLTNEKLSRFQDLWNNSLVETSQKEFELLELPFIIRRKITSFCKKNSFDKKKMKFKIDLHQDWVIDSNLIESLLQQLQKVEEIDIKILKANDLKTNPLNLDSFGILYFSIAEDKIFEEGIEKNQIEFYNSEIKRSREILSNQGFIRNAPSYLIEKEKEKLVRYEEQRRKFLNRL